jgi:autotransporter-associated beta strand protein
MKRLRLAAAFVAGIGLIAFPTMAATHTWVAGNNGNWSDAANWMGGVPSEVGAALVFPTSGALSATANNDLSNLSISTITFTGSPSAYYLTGNAITLTGGASIDPSGAGSYNYLQMSIALSGPQTFSTAAGNGNLWQRVGVVSGPAAATLTYTGGTCELQGNNTFSGNISVNSGASLWAAHANALGDTVGTTTLAAGSFLVLLASGIAEPLIVQGGKIIFSVGPPVVFAGTVSLAATPNVDVASGQIGTFAGILSGTGGLGVGTDNFGPGTLILTQNNTYTGTTTVQNSTLRVNGLQPASAVTVATGGKLQGTGTIGPLTVNSGGKVQPGASPGVLSVTGTTTFASGSTFEVELNGATVGTEYDKLAVTGNVNLGGATLAVILGYSPALNTPFTIVQATGGTISGTFTGLANNATLCVGGQNFQINYTANAVTLTAKGLEMVAPTVTAPTDLSTTQTLCM